MQLTSLIVSLALVLATPAVVADLPRSCLSMMAILAGRTKVARTVIQKAEKNQSYLMRTPEGRIWVGYLKNLQSVDLNAPAEGNRPVPREGVVLNTIDYMASHVKQFTKELEKGLPNPLGTRTVQEQLLANLSVRLAAAQKGATIQRAELVQLGQLFSVAATQQIYLGENRTQFRTNFGTFAQILEGSKRKDEATLDDLYGISALPLPSVEHLGFRRFIELEPTGVFPIGITAKLESVDGGTLDPNRFEEHDWAHQRFRMSVNNPLLLPMVFKRPKTDHALYVGMEPGLQFAERLLKQIDGLANRRKQLIAEGLVFEIMHEQNTASGIVHFTARNVRKGAQQLLRSRVFGRTNSTRDYDNVLNRFQSEDDFGQAFRNKPSDAELVEALKWITTIAD